MAKNRGSHSCPSGIPKIEPQLGIIPSPTSGREERMSFSLRSIPSVILFLPFWSFQSPRQNCRGLSQGGSSLSGALSEKGGGQPGSQKPLPSHRPSLPSLPWWHPWGSGRLGGYHIFTWMNCSRTISPVCEAQTGFSSTSGMHVFPASCFITNICIVASAREILFPISV